MTEKLFSAMESPEVRASEPKRLEGYGAVFYDGTPATEYWIWSDIVERIAKTAFDRAIKEDDCRCLFNHDPNCVLGRTTAKTLRLSVDAKGMRYECDLDQTGIAGDVARFCQRGDISGSSFSFTPIRATWTEEKTDSGTVWIRTIEEVQLFDVGPVTFPAYEGTTTGARSITRPRRSLGDVSEIRAELDRWQAARRAEADQLRERRLLEHERLRLELDEIAAGA